MPGFGTRFEVNWGLDKVNDVAETRAETLQGSHAGNHQLQHKLVMEQKVSELSVLLTLKGKKQGQGGRRRH